MRGTPLYVHLPFCVAKCHYCDFFSVPAEGQDREGMVAAILREAELRAPREPETVFLGGGTPSLLEPHELRRLLDGLDRITGFRASASEVTAECNPESLDRERARTLLELGVNRLSIGLQSLHDDVLQLFGRVHGGEDGLRAYADARAAGAENVNVDLIFAIPGQAPEQWERDLARVLAEGPDHLSAYNLTFEEDTVFRRWLDQGRLTREPEEVELEMFHATRRIAAEHGLAAYEVSNFARAGRTCAHNLNYWHNGPYVGIGPSAVSRVGARRFGNVKAIAAYVRRIAEEGCATGWEETPDAGTRLAETWWLGLRLAEGVDAARARRTAGWDVEPDPAQGVAAGLVEQGLLEHADDRYRLSERGLPLADHVASEFLVPR